MIFNQGFSQVDRLLATVCNDQAVRLELLELIVEELILVILLVDGHKRS